MKYWLLFSIAGALGSLSRYGFSKLIDKILGSSFPWGIFITNVSGCFLFGVGWSLITVLHLFSDTTRIFLLTGFLGAFTTFSTFIFDSQIFLEGGQWMAFLVNIFGQIILGMLALRLGVSLVKIFY